MAFPAKKRVIQASWRVIDLAGVHTKVLLKLLEQSRHRRYRYEHDPPAPYNLDVPIACVRAELAKREHVLNKPEARQARRAAAKTRNRRRKSSGHRRPANEP
jgi:hypothetical protein